MPVIVLVEEAAESSGCSLFFIFLLLIAAIVEFPLFFMKLLVIILVLIFFLLIIGQIYSKEHHPIINILFSIIIIILIIKIYIPSDKMVNIPNTPGKEFSISNTEVTQKLYSSIMNVNPSYNKNPRHPVERVSWYDAIYFCNKLSEMRGKTPVYSVNGTTDVRKWNYIPHNGNSLGKVSWNKKADGYRLPTEEEWEYAAIGINYGVTHKIIREYSGSDSIFEVGWFKNNSKDKTHPVAKKKSNGFGMYDMTGNVWEWCWDIAPNSKERSIRGCSYSTSNGGTFYVDYCNVKYRNYNSPNERYSNLGFRVVAPIINPKEKNIVKSLFLDFRTKDEKRIVKSTGLNVRENAGTEYPVKFTISKGTVVHLTNPKEVKNGCWVKIKCDKGYGWVNSTLLTDY